MGRPDLTTVRTAEILDAFARCVARYGLEGSSLERVAEEAGMKRSILRHYIGNRDEMVDALAERVVAKYQADTQGWVESLAADTLINDLLDFFFPAQPRSSAETILVVEALIGTGDRYPNVRRRMLDYVEDLVRQTSRALRKAYPEASSPQCWAVAYGVVSICFNQESLTALELPAKYLRAARSCALQLIESLGSSG